MLVIGLTMLLSAFTYAATLKKTKHAPQPTVTMTALYEPSHTLVFVAGDYALVYYCSWNAPATAEFVETFPNGQTWVDGPFSFDAGGANVIWDWQINLIDGTPSFSVQMIIL